MIILTIFGDTKLQDPIDITFVFIGILQYKVLY